jgi:hypothetical protein
VKKGDPKLIKMVKDEWKSNLTKIHTLSDVIFAKAYVGPIESARLEAKRVFNDVITPVISKPVDYIIFS